ncbi:hypothetical protein F955_01051 [Acinetobacter schindleri CIP 107287]|uniref:Uncharacterized protein n=1 Tax=Acinetobacter schindleri CIP 107287 TaxID=1217988 RepID=N9ALQ2_9GAMM|nr:hypothetical protein F955_01051 [Acinetobacter schindleri CIP 107287]
MHSYISEPNKHIEDYLDYYFDGNKNFEYAVLLNGGFVAQRFEMQSAPN